MAKVLWVVVLCALQVEAVTIRKEEMRGITAEDLQERDVRSSDRREYYYLPSGPSRPHISSAGYDYEDHYNPVYEHHLPGPDYYAPPAKPSTHSIFSLKSILVPIAGLAILGAAAALSTNPVLLQLGVLKGRRRKRSPEGVYPVNPFLKPAGKRF